MTVSSTQATIGDLLVATGAASEAQVAQALSVTNKTGLPLGRVLAETGVVDAAVIRGCVLAQALMQDNLLPYDLAVKALNLVKLENIQIEEALQKLGWRAEYYERIKNLGGTLLEAGCITEAQLKVGLEVAFASGLPLVRVLVLRQVLPVSLAHAALGAQTLLKQRAIDTKQAIEMIKEAKRGTDATSGIKLSAGAVRLGELLVAAQVITEIDLLSSVEVAVLHESPIGGVLVRSGAITNSMLTTALEVQRQFNEGKLEWEDALSALYHSKGDSSQSEIHMQQVLRPLAAPAGAAKVQSNEEFEKALQQLEYEKQTLAFKIVSQHEEIKTSLARELHDTIIADLMMLKRYLSGDKKLSPAETIDIVDHVITQLRDVCCDFSPRQLQDLGLQASLIDLLDRMEKRTGIKCEFISSGEPPIIEGSVRLHMFRIIQECLNNAEKYSGASAVTVEMKSTPDLLQTIIRDNGKGFSQTQTNTSGAEGGMGMGSMQERCQLIRVHHPAKLAISSQPGKGSEITLEIKFKRSETPNKVN